MKNSKVLTRKEQAEIWKSLLTRVEKLKVIIEAIESIEDYDLEYLKRPFTKELLNLEILIEEILTANEIQLQ